MFGIVPFHLKSRSSYVVAPLLLRWNGTILNTKQNFRRFPVRLVASHHIIISHHITSYHIRTHQNKVQKRFNPPFSPFFSLFSQFFLRSLVFLHLSLSLSFVHFELSFSQTPQSPEKPFAPPFFLSPLRFWSLSGLRHHDFRPFFVFTDAALSLSPRPGGSGSPHCSLPSLWW